MEKSQQTESCINIPYYRDQLAIFDKLDDMKIKVTSGDDLKSTNWLNLNADSAKAVIKLMERIIENEKDGE